MNIQLDHSVERVITQFSFSNAGAVPSDIISRSPETVEELRSRINRPETGSVFLIANNCSLVGFQDGLRLAGYEPIEGFHQLRINPKNPRMERRYQMVRFVFGRPDPAMAQFPAVRRVLSAALEDMGRAAMWLVEVFSNPFFKDGQIVNGRSALVINLKGRNPLFSPEKPDGQPVVVWQKDEKGERIGEGPVPLAPSCFLRVVDNEICLVAA
ncbi:MAG: hypothetical protein COX90_01965 [Candidatus Nealsonbacteria bacterium CG_4_10_14_0_2_um_filter_38_17]|uniref:Uncharacterized protein n=2 Tax=Candidatus Nealsoniibacteriota TaxID=1817911 RepID=A0A2M7UYA5_9BACT|nr:MAG: hypothetical protein COX36_01340 [Candidatus Nealsonbacteria bacterium CG23_combo_of_CG06-09_8_20_14_all_38_19]PIZ88930.1 MAG: hypothetical protein COX90_01965 [Candidatus Nealsonbacteria bacterium CG_4_10_14_0_2_um_filter_38_17]